MMSFPTGSFALQRSCWYSDDDAAQPFNGFWAAETKNARSGGVPFMFFNAFFSKRQTSTRTSSRQTKKRKRTWLELQLLEDRCTPASAGSQAIITQAYPGLLN